MIHEIETHQRELTENTESFLQENIGDFKRDLDFVIMLMKNGRRLTAKSLVQEFGIADRRLRDAYLNRESIKQQSGWEIKKEWKLNEKGKRMYVEYFAISPIPNKGKLITMYQGLLKQQELF